VAVPVSTGQPLERSRPGAHPACNFPAHGPKCCCALVTPRWRSCPCKPYNSERKGAIYKVCAQGTVWSQYDGTEEGVAEALVRADIPRDRIVLAFKPPNIRLHTDFVAA